MTSGEAPIALDGCIPGDDALHEWERYHDRAPPQAPRIGDRLSPNAADPEAGCQISTRREWRLPTQH
jgi:hypothetical protein